MGLINVPIPEINEDNPGADADVVSALRRMVGELNGGIDAANFAGALAVSKQASPNYGSWRLIRQVAGKLDSGAAAATNFFRGDADGTDPRNGAIWTPPAAGDVAVGGMTQRYRLVAQVLCFGAIGNSLTFGLRAVDASAGAAGVLSITVNAGFALSAAFGTGQLTAGARVRQAGVEAALATLTAPAYVFTVTNAGAIPAGVRAGFTVRLEARHA
jgi:hypothetical protein